MPSHSSTAQHRWKFFRTSGLDQAALQNESDLRNLRTLDQKLWVALSCPVKGLEIDERTLSLIDSDQNGRIRVPEILEAIDWCGTRLKNLDVILDPQAALPLALIDDQTTEGKTLLSSARQILASQGKSESLSLSVEDTSDPKKIFANTSFNGDGIVTESATEMPAEKQAIREIISLYGGELDRSGQLGYNQAKLDQYFADAEAYLVWLDAGTKADIEILGNATNEAMTALKAVRAKIDDYFARCSLAAFDPRALNALNRQESEYLVVASKDLTLTSAEMAGFPLARIDPDRDLPLERGVNPSWSAAIERFRKTVVQPLFNSREKVTLSATEWTKLVSALAPFELWQNSHLVSPIESLGLPRIREIATASTKAGLERLLAEDKRLEPEALAISSLERLTRYYRDLGTLLRNFVNFSDFYHPDRWASFQAGKLYFDSRSCDLCVRVDDPAAHSILASLSKCYIAYCDLKRGTETIKIAAAFTQGGSDYLMVGRNGLFYDRKGRDWDATIIKIIDNPISLRESFWSPYKKFIRTIEQQVAKRAATAESKTDTDLTATATTVANVDQKKSTEPKRLDVGTVAALGVAVGAIGTAFGYFLGLFKGLDWWEFPLVLLGLMLVISLPSVLIAWIKLRQRTLGPILDATGWAINARVRINIPFGTSLTQRAKLPAGSIHLLHDPFKEKSAAKRSLVVLLLILAGVGAYAGYAYRAHRWPFPPVPKAEKTPAPDPVENKAG